MRQEMEIEFKNLLTNSEYQRIKNFLQLEDPLFKKQENHYFDTNDYALKSHGAALRIREKKGTWELTLKQPRLDEHGLIETNQVINE